jgi:two-component system chemotaxis response regulator CheY
MRMIVRRCLREAGYSGCEVDEAANGAEALGRIGQQRPDLVLSDWNMPEMNGLELLRALRGTGIKLGFITSEGTPEMRMTAMAAGAQFLVAKPFTAESFQRALKPIIGF